MYRALGGPLRVPHQWSERGRLRLRGICPVDEDETWQAFEDEGINLELTSKGEERKERIALGFASSTATF